MKARRFSDRWDIWDRTERNLRNFRKDVQYFCQSPRLDQIRNRYREQKLQCKMFSIGSLGKVAFFSRIVRHLQFCKPSSRYDRCNRIKM